MAKFRFYIVFFKLFWLFSMMTQIDPQIHQNVTPFQIKSYILSMGHYDSIMKSCNCQELFISHDKLVLKIFFHIFKKDRTMLKKLKLSQIMRLNNFNSFPIFQGPFASRKNQFQLFGLKFKGALIFLTYKYFFQKMWKKSLKPISYMKIYYSLQLKLFIMLS